MTAFDFWTKRFGKEPKKDSEKLSVAMMAEYGKSQWNEAIDACISKLSGTDYLNKLLTDELEKLKKK